MHNLRFDNRVVVVTGAGAGLGRAYALLFASRGASVVVNDLGGGRSGDGSSTKAADTVVQEIRAQGGKAVADYNSVVEGEKIIETALNNFGRVDIVINNAGILRDRSFARISKNDWDLIHDVHLKGAFKVTQAAWPHFRKQNYGRVIMTSSNAGVLGNFGQANYSAAKMGLIGLSNTLAIEGKKNNINCNTIVPTAASRLTEDILPPDLFNELKPELIAPVVVWLCHESCTESGSIIETAAGWAAKIQVIRGKGCLLRKSLTDFVTPEDVRNNWKKIIDLNNSDMTTNIQEATMSLVSHLETLRNTDASEEYSSSEVQNSESFSYGNKEVILYALGIGSTLSVNSDLKFLYESHENFSVFPTFGIIPAVLAVMSNKNTTEVIPNKTFDLSQVLHGEQYMELLKPLPTEGKLKSVCSVVDVVDKGKSGALIVTNVDTYNEKGEKVIFNQVVAFVVGAGNFGGKKQSDNIKAIVDIPSRKPDKSYTEKTNIDQAAIYRLSGDFNPLHIDPDFASIAGYKRPILHGLCTLGFAVRHILYNYANNDPKLFKALKVRFAKPVIPGQALKTDMWQEGSKIYFQTSAVDSNVVVLTGGYVELYALQQSTEQIEESNVEEANNLSSDIVFDGMQERINTDPSLLKKINGVFVYNITKNGKLAATWTADLKSGKVYRGTPTDGIKADTTITIDDNDMVEMAIGKLNPQVAFIKGKLKVKGNIILAQKLRSLTVESKM